MLNFKKMFGLKTLSITLTTALLGTSTIIPQTSKANAASIPTNATISVDANISQGELYRSEKHFNISKHFTYGEQRKADVQFMNDQGLHNKIFRTWVDQDIYDLATDTYNFSNYDVYFSDTSQMADALLVNIKAEGVIPVLKSPEQVKPIVKNIIKHLKQNHPKIKYIEALNEPDDPQSNRYKGLVTPDTVYSYYKAFSDAVYEVNAELNPEVPLQVGGPAIMRLDMDWIGKFLDGYKNDPSPKKKLDFISYHGYFVGPNFTGFVKEDPSMVDNQRSQIDAALSSRGLSTDIPSFITETGIYPGPLSDVPNANGGVQPDQLRQAAGLASLHYWYMNSSKNYAFQWELRHPDNARKDALVSRDRYNVKLSNIPSDKFTPYGNMMVMLSKMKATRISATSDSIVKGKGVYSIASKDDTGVSLMVWNYQGKDSQNYNTSIHLSQLPAIFSGKHIRVKTYKIDATTNNYYANSDNSNLQLVEDKIVAHNGSYSTTAYLDPNNLQLLVLEPIDTNTLLNNIFDEEVTGAAPGWILSTHAGTSVSIANVPSTVNRSVYLADGSTNGYAQISKTFNAQSEAFTVKWKFKDDAELKNARFQLKQGLTVTADVYVNDALNLVANGTVIQGVSPGIWYDVSLAANPVTNKYDIYMNNTLKAAGIPFTASVTSVDTISFRTGDSTKNSLYIDNVTVQDITPPAWASNKQVTAPNRTERTISLSWNGADHTAVAYQVYNGNTLSNTVTGATYTTVANLVPGRSYNFTVQAVDANGNVSTDGPTLTLATVSSDISPSNPVSNGGSTAPVGASSGTSVTVDSNGKADATSLKSALSASRNIEIRVNGDNVSLPATGLSEASRQEGSSVTVTSTDGSYVLPLSVFRLDDISKSMGVSLSDLQVKVTIKKVSGDSAKGVMEAASRANAKSLSDAVDFNVVVEDKNGKSVPVSFGSNYISRSVDIHKSVDPNKTTGALFNEITNSLTFVPSTFVAKDGKTVATLKRNGNSIYTVVEVNKSFEDLSAHWARADIELLANKLVVDGVSERIFDADRNITRAEFAALIVRALGLSSMKTASSFADVKADAWYSDAVSTASAAGIIQGYENGMFRPEAQITREELAAMVIRAMNYAGVSTGVDHADQTVLLSQFKDASKISWGQKELAAAISAKLINGMSEDKLGSDEKATRAQTAVILKRFLKAAQFIN
jgi:hypothetical protein